MICCGIDAGSNTVRMLIADVSDGKITKVISSERAITRLGGDIIKTGRLSGEGISKTLKLFKHFHAETMKHKVEKIFSAATSAVREAENSMDFIIEARKIGIPLVTLSENEEAYYTYRGVLSGMDLGQLSAVVYDIGGGSTEIIYGRGDKILYSKSVPLGVVKLADIFNFKEPSGKKKLRDAAEYIRSILAPVFGELKAVAGSFESILPVGTAGTVTAVSAVDMSMKVYDPDIVSRHILTNGRLSHMLEWLPAMTAEERLSVDGVEQGREDLIVPGIIIIGEILNFLGADTSAVSDKGLREGLTIAANT